MMAMDVLDHIDEIAAVTAPQQAEINQLIKKEGEPHILIRRDGDGCLNAVYVPSRRGFATRDYSTTDDHAAPREWQWMSFKEVTQDHDAFQLVDEKQEDDRRRTMLTLIDQNSRVARQRDIAWGMLALANLGKGKKADRQTMRSLRKKVGKRVIALITELS